jgi:hypothetical protein
MQDGRAKVKQNMQDGRAKKCKMFEQRFFKKMQDGRAKVKQSMQDGRAKKCKTAEQKKAMVVEIREPLFCVCPTWHCRFPDFLSRGRRALKR